VRLTPKGGRNALDGLATLSDGRVAVKARVRAVPEDGGANEALIALVAKTLGAPKASISLASGHTSRLKVLNIKGDGAALAARLEAALKDSA
jgi:uncharacterized protein YggU (UPF0235/DUF167 family)